MQRNKYINRKQIYETKHIHRSLTLDNIPKLLLKPINNLIYGINQIQKYKETNNNKYSNHCWG